MSKQLKNLHYKFAKTFISHTFVQLNFITKKNIKDAIGFRIK